MPKVDDNFAGHVFNEDPRNLLTAAFGCVWPTFPAYRYLLDAPNATSVWGLFKNFPPLLQLSSDLDEHDTGRWNIEAAAPFFEYIRWDKLSIDSELDGFEWILTWKLVGNPTVINNSFTVTSPRACNADVALPNWTFPGVPGELGSGAVMRQVVFDETTPPT